MFILVNLWMEEAPDRLCKSNVFGGHVENQLECQAMCTEGEGCVGISYSHIVSTACYLCMDDILSVASAAYGFYRTPGKFPVN